MKTIKKSAKKKFKNSLRLTSLLDELWLSALLRVGIQIVAGRVELLLGILQDMLHTKLKIGDAWHRAGVGLV